MGWTDPSSRPEHSPPRRGGERPKKLLYALPAPAFWLGVWQFCAFLVDRRLEGKGNELLLPYPVSVWNALTVLAGTGEFWATIFSSLGRIAIGLACGLLLGAGLAVLTCASPWADRLLSPAIRVVRAAPVASFILLVLLIFFAAIGVPLAFAIGASCITYILTSAPTFLGMLPQRIWNGAYSELMIAMPLFMLAGELMNTGGITQRIINFCSELLRPVRGGLGEVNIVASMIFGGISGSSVADTSCLGSVLIPEMEKRGYPPSLAAGVTVASSTMGMVIPPSSPMIMFSMLTGASVGALFVAGLIPGLLVGVLQLAVCYVISKKNGYHPKLEKLNVKKMLYTMLTSLPAVIMPVILVLVVVLTAVFSFVSWILPIALPVLVILWILRLISKGQ